MKTFLFFLFFLSLFMTGCAEKPPLSLSPRHRAAADTLYTHRVQGLREELDSICDANYDQWLRRAVDSMLEVRKAEEAELRRRKRLLE